MWSEGTGRGEGEGWGLERQDVDGKLQTDVFNACSLSKTHTSHTHSQVT